MLSSNKNKVLEVFFKKPTEAFHVRELARLTNLNPNTIINLIKELSNEDLITKERKKHIVEVAAKINEKFKREKRIYNLKSICNSGVIDLLIKELSPKSISVVGSYSFGEDIENSDIDLVAISENDKQIDLSKFEKARPSLHAGLPLLGFLSSEELYIPPVWSCWVALSEFYVSTEPRFVAPFVG